MIYFKRLKKDEMCKLKNGITFKLVEYDYLNVNFRYNGRLLQFRIRKKVKPMFTYTYTKIPWFG